MPMNRVGMTRRGFLACLAAGSALGWGGHRLIRRWELPAGSADVCIARSLRYPGDLSGAILSGFRELGVREEEIRGKTILLKPNLVEPHAGEGHINTHPLVVRGAAEAFLRHGASRVLVAEGTGHCLDTERVLEKSGLREVLREDRIPFVDLNRRDWKTLPNRGGFTRLGNLALPDILLEADWVVSLPKMKTHHWAGVTLSMKNLFGVMPGSIYGWPKNVLHWQGIHPSILDIFATVRPHFAIVDGIVGMEGDGPIMGTPKEAGVLAMGRNLPAVDATCARIMGIDPLKIPYLAVASGRYGPILEGNIRQRGEPVASVRTDFALEERVEAHRGIRLSANPAS